MGAAFDAAAVVAIVPDDADSMAGSTVGSPLLHLASPSILQMEGDMLMWAGFPNLGRESHAATLLDHLGYSLDTPLQEFGSVPKTDFEEELTTWQHNVGRPPLAARSRAKQAGHAARGFLGIDYTVAEERACDHEQVAYQRDMEWRAAQAPPVALASVIHVTAPTSAAIAPSRRRLVAIKDIAGKAPQVFLRSWITRDRQSQTHTTKS